MKKLMYLFCCLTAALLFAAAPAPKTVMADIGPLTKVNLTNSPDFKGATDLVLDNNGSMYISDHYNNRVVIFNASGGYVGLYDQLNNPSGLAIDDGNLYVANTGNNTIVIIDIATGTREILDGANIDPNAGNVGFNQPMGVTIYNNRIYVADTYNHRIVIFDKQTRDYEAVIGGNGSGDGRGSSSGANGTAIEFNQPYALAFDSSGSMFVSDTFNYRVLRLALDINGNYVYNGVFDNDGNPCYGIAVDSRNNNVYIADRQNSNIRGITDGTTISNGERPVGVYITGNSTGNNTMYTVDVNANLIKRATVTYSTTPDTPSTNTTGGGSGPTTNNNNNNEEENNEVVNPTPQALPTSRLAGNDRIGTAIEISRQDWADGAETVVLAYAYLFPDALAAAPLAVKLNAPILLSDLEAITPSTLAEIQRLNPSRIVLVGGTAVLSQNLEDTLAANYTVTRFFGYTRYDTAAAIAEELGTTTGAAIIVNGNFFPDALVSSSYAAYEQIPILFTDTQEIPAVTTQKLSTLGINRTVVVGGTVVVNEQIYSQLPNPTRYAGYTHYDTAVEVAVGLAMNLKNVFVATGVDFPDALVAGAYAGKNKNPLIMVNSIVDTLPTSTESFFRSNKASIENITIIGGTSVVKQVHEAAIQSLLQ